MDHGTNQILFALLRSAICGEPLSDAEKAQFFEAQIPALLATAKQHDIIHLLALGLKQNALCPGNEPEIRKHILLAVYRYEQQRAELEKLCRTLESAEIPFLPLKGSVLRGYYPEAWMRTSCDIDILVHKEDSEYAKSVLIEKFGYKYGGMGSHDISLFTPTGIHVELHYDLLEDGRVNESSKVLKSVWSDVVVSEGFRFWHEMPDEMFYFYHIAHMAKHFEDGGCGIRPFIDLWILDTIHNTDKKKRDDLLATGNLLVFANTVRKLSRVWFENEEHDFVTQQMEDYILRGGVYGNIKNHIIVHQQKKGGQIKYALSKIFIPYDVIKFHYPVLQRHRWLTPFMQVRRWCKLIFCGHLRRTLEELKYNSNVSDVDAVNAQKFLSDIGL